MLGKLFNAVKIRPIRQVRYSGGGPLVPVPKTLVVSSCIADRKDEYASGVVARYNSANSSVLFYDCKAFTVLQKEVWTKAHLEHMGRLLGTLINKGRTEDNVVITHSNDDFVRFLNAGKSGDDVIKALIQKIQGQRLQFQEELWIVGRLPKGKPPLCHLAAQNLAIYAFDPSPADLKDCIKRMKAEHSHFPIKKKEWENWR